MTDLMTDAQARTSTSRHDAAGRSPRPRLRRLLRNAGWYLLLASIGVVFLLPFLFLLSASLKPGNQDVFSTPPDLIPRPPVLDSYIKAWTTIPLLQYLINSLIYVGIGVPLYVVVTAVTAYPLAIMRFRGRNTVFFALLAAMFLPSELLLIPRYLIMGELHLLNTYPGVILPGLVSTFAIFLLRQAFASVPRELADAARIDGCGEWRIFWNVMLPTVRPTLAIAAIFGFIAIWNDFLWPLVVLNSDSLYPLSLGVAYLAGIAGLDLRLVSAGTVISIIPIVIFFIFLQRHVMEAAKGAVKG
ncbi:putative chitobiose transport system permease protein [Microbacterium sp. W4I4]|uniref:carbohydrate ABC transporter permease n=1 Tax=Microbacterium sp. W4I4 TaxID=3042295 RepID=UPI00277F88FD|nr:carbohydrate ABC transporter permease [Microbacterium sp. W4I4]MDQ0615339.1 putative chitobiose transport system permease protein [Microbacterium sp. W4I4]